MVVVLGSLGGGAGWLLQWAGLTGAACCGGGGGFPWWVLGAGSGERAGALLGLAVALMGSVWEGGGGVCIY